MLQLTAHIRSGRSTPLSAGPCMENSTPFQLMHGGCMNLGIVSHIPSACAKHGQVCPMQGMRNND